MFLQKKKKKNQVCQYSDPNTVKQYRMLKFTVESSLQKMFLILYAQFSLQLDFSPSSYVLVSLGELHIKITKRIEKLHIQLTVLQEECACLGVINSLILV